MLLFSEESHMTSTCDKARKVVNDGRGGGGREGGRECVTDVLSTF